MDRLLQQFRPLDILGYFIPGFVLLVLSVPLFNKYIGECFAGFVWFERDFSRAIILVLAYPIGFIVSLLTSIVIEWCSTTFIRKKSWLNVNVASFVEGKMREKGIVPKNANVTHEELLSLADSFLQSSPVASVLDRSLAIDRMAAGMAGVCGAVGMAYLYFVYADGLSVRYEFVAYALLLLAIMFTFACKNDVFNRHNLVMSLAAVELSK
jgi:hypothetical protein